MSNQLKNKLALLVARMELKDELVQVKDNIDSSCFVAAGENRFGEKGVKARPDAELMHSMLNHGIETLDTEINTRLAEFKEHLNTERLDN